MNIRWHSILRWTPRILSIFFALFLSLFALDVFAAGYSMAQMIGAFLIHEIPVFILLLGLALAWRWPWVGTIIFVGFGLWYIVEAWGAFPFVVYLMIVGPALLVGALFFASWLDQARHPTPHTT